MYFTIKYNVSYKYIINATTTAINACKKLIASQHTSKQQNVYISILYIFVVDGKESNIEVKMFLSDFVYRCAKNNARY
jgi:hypothetical protein